MSNNLVLEQVERDVGAASSLLVFVYFVSGAASMGLISLNWPNHIRVIALLAIGSGIVILTAFQLIGHFWKSAMKSLR
jgi:DHA1 family bicyclomycin/chloramphenicol resistance-like MFS transporter